METQEDTQEKVERQKNLREWARICVSAFKVVLDFISSLVR